MNTSLTLAAPGHAARPSVDGRGPGRDRCETDLLDLLARAHRDHDHRCRQLRGRRDVEGDGLERFVVDVLVHETLEELLLHPLVAGRLPTGPDLATDRLIEQWLLALSLHRLLGTPPLDADLAGFHQQLVEHDDREELEVFPLFRHVAAGPELARLGGLYELAHRRVSQGLVGALRQLQPAARAERSRLLRHVRDTAEAALLDLGAEPPAGHGA